MHEGQNGGTTSLTVDQAKEVFEGLLSAQEDTEPRETPPAPEAEEPEDTTPEPEESEQEPTDDEGQSDETDEQTDDEPTPEPRKFKVKADGQELEVTEDELLKGYSRTADYTRKTQQLSEQRKQFETEQTAVRAERAEYATRIAQLADALQAMTPAEPDWDKLREQDPVEAANVWMQWQQHKERLAAIEAERQRAAEAVASDQRTQMQARLEGEKAKVLEVIPAWKDAEVAKKEKSELIAFAKEHGYTDEELAQVYDHRVLVLLRKAMLHDRAEKAKPAVKQKLEQVKVATPGPAASAKRAPVSEETRAKQRLAKTGRIEDAADVFLQILDD